ncbi:30S ribosomal protein S6 [Mycoplasmopsis sturni]|uniref:30S ribosomal protein S6 n=1 Tax=Mycoplasmopsis sturni TaxID=39047 RepID=UPI000559E3DA|nr:30S ribosomal protein S6 [Mycoplasmopsis sturni]
MSKYEIMMIVDPKADIAIAEKLLKEVFGKGVQKAEKLERTDLAYEINKSKQAQYLLAEITSPSDLIAEFTRKANILKEIWRFLVINLDTEKGFGKEFKVLGRKKTDARPGKKEEATEEPKKRAPRVKKETKTQE